MVISVVINEIEKALKDLKAEKGKISAKFEWPEDAEVFKGHFPGLPIIPGVVQVRMAQHVLSKALGKPLQLTEAKKVKFLSLGKPNMELTLDLEYQQEGDLIQAKGELKNSEGKVSSFGLKFQ